MTYLIGRTILGAPDAVSSPGGFISLDSPIKGESGNGALPSPPVRRTAGTSPLRSALPQHADADLEPYRIRSPHKVQSLLKKLLAGSVLVTLSTPRGKTYITMVWAIDPVRDVLSLAADVGSARAQDMLGAGVVTAVAYLNGVKLQFDLPGLELLLGRSSGVFSAPVPRELCLFQRRQGKRAQPANGTFTRARVRHPAQPQGHMSLRVMDIGISGVALTLPSHMPAFQAGMLLRGVDLDLESGGRVTVDLQVHHVTEVDRSSRVARVGCALVNPSDECLRAMERNFDAMSLRGRRPPPARS